MPAAEVTKMEARTGNWSDDVIKELNILKSGSPEAHGAAGHHQYSVRARYYMEKYHEEMLKKGINPSNLHGDKAAEYARGMHSAVVNSGDDYIKGYLELVRGGKTQPEIKAWANAYEAAAKIDGSGKTWWRAVEIADKSALKMLSREAIKVVLKYGSYAVAIGFAAKASNAAEQIEAVLPPGADLVWSVAGKVFDAQCQKMRKANCGEGESDNGFSGQRKDLKEVMGGF